MIELRQDLTKTCSDTKKGNKKLTAPAEDGIDITEFLIREKKTKWQKKKGRGKKEKRIKLQWKKECDVGEKGIKKK